MASNEVTARPSAPAVHAKLNFQPATAPVPTGFTAENGQPYSTTTGRGWVTQASLGDPTHTPLDLNSTGPHTALSDGNTRDRNRAGIAQELDTVIHMQYGDVFGTTNANGNLTPGAFEYAVPNGTYRVTVSVGDEPGGAHTGCAAPCYDSVHNLRVEGVTAIDHFQPSTAAEYKQATVTVVVSDGRLTVDAVGGNNTKLDYLTVDSAAPDTVAPAAPTAVQAQPGDGSVALMWAANTDTDLAGYRVYRSTGATPDPATATPLNPTLLTAASFTDRTVSNGTAYHYVVSAVDTSGNESAASAVASATPVSAPSTALDVNFADAATTAPRGYVTDFGEPYAARTGAGQGTGLTYGWVQSGTSTPLSLVGNGRNRNTGTPAAGQPDPRLATFVHMQLPSNATGGVSTPGTWEAAVPNGAYTVTVAVGDAGTAVDSTNWINVEDQNARRVRPHRRHPVRHGHPHRRRLRRPVDRQCGGRHQHQDRLRHGRLGAEHGRPSLRQRPADAEPQDRGRPDGQHRRGPPPAQRRGRRRHPDQRQRDPDARRGQLERPGPLRDQWRRRHRQHHAG